MHQKVRKVTNKRLNRAVLKQTLVLSWFPLRGLSALAHRILAGNDSTPLQCN